MSSWRRENSERSRRSTSSTSSSFLPKLVERVTPSLLGNGYSVQYNRDVTSSLGLYQKSSSVAFSKEQLSWSGSSSLNLSGSRDSKFGRVASFTSQYAPGMEFRDTSMGSLLKEKGRIEKEQAKASEKLIRLTELRKKVEAQRELAQRERKRKQEKRELRTLAATAMQSLIRGFICRRRLVNRKQEDRNTDKDSATFFVTTTNNSETDEETPETEHTSELVAMKTPGMIDLERNAPVAVLR